jgi:hypothetical protein
MSFIHESLYQNKDFSSIDMANYIDGLSRNLVMSYSLNGKVSMERDLQKVRVGIGPGHSMWTHPERTHQQRLQTRIPRWQAGTVKIGLEIGRRCPSPFPDDGMGLPEGLQYEQ